MLVTCEGRDKHGHGGHVEVVYHATRHEGCPVCEQIRTLGEEKQELLAKVENLEADVADLRRAVAAHATPMAVAS